MERAVSPRLSRDGLVDVSLAAVAAVASCASLLAYGGGRSAIATAFAVASALVLVGIRRLFLRRNPPLGSVCAMVAAWVLATSYAWFAYAFAGYAPPRISDATTIDALLFPLLIGAAFTTTFAYVLSRRRTRAAREKRAFVPIAIGCSGIAAFVLAAIAWLVGLCTPLMNPLASSRLAKAESRLHAGLTAAELCREYPYRTENACNPPSRWLHEKGLPGLRLHFSTAEGFCVEGGMDLEVTFSAAETVTSWKRTPSSVAC